MGYKEWSNTTIGSYSARGLYKYGTSGGADLFAPDASIITVARGTTLVYMETLTAGKSGDYLGLRNSTSGNRNTWISTGLYSYQSYYVADLGGGPGGTFNGEYGGNTCTAIFTMDSYPNQSRIYGHAEGTAQRNYDQSENFEARYVKTSSGLGTWASITDIRGYTYAAITLDTQSYAQWYRFSYYFYGGFSYDITFQVYCPSNAYEGIAVFNYQRGFDGEEQKQIKNLNNVIFYCQANENGGYKNFTYNAPVNTTLHFYFIRNNVFTNDYWRRAYIKIIMKNNVVVYGNGNGDSTTTYKITPYVANSGVILTPKTRTGSNGIAYTFKGFFTSSGGGSMDYDSTGKLVENKDKILYSNGSYYYNVYAGWGNTISYSPYTTYVSTYCTTAASASNKASGNVSVKVAAEPARCASGETLSVSIYPYNRFTPNSDAQYLTVSNGLGIGIYTGGTMYLSSKSGSNYQSMELSKVLPSIRLLEVKVSNYGTPTTPTITQKTNIYPSVYSINSNNVTTFFSGKNSTQTITYTNGATRNGSITYEWGGSKTLDLGRTYMPSSSTVNFNNSVYVCAKGENSIYSSKAYISTATVASNVVTNLYLLEPYNSESSQPNDLYWSDPDGSQRLFLIVARYTSGEEIEILNNGGNVHYSYYASPTDMLSVVMISGY